MAQSQNRIQTLFFSATLHSPEVLKSIQDLTENPSWVDLKGKPNIPDTVNVIIYGIEPNLPLPFKPVNPAVQPTTDGIFQLIKSRPSTEEILSQTIKLHKIQAVVRIADTYKMNTAMIFCRTNVDCNNLEIYLNALGGGRAFSGKTETGKENPYSCVVLAGMRSQQERMANLKHFKQGDVRFLICTDVAARGIDIHELPFMIMTTLPDDPDLFFHRVGRVGRADRMGLAICLVATEKENVWYHQCSSRGKGCTHIDTIDKGGCTIWYDEPQLIRDIEVRVGSSLIRVDTSNFAIEGIFEPEGCSTTKEDDDIRPKRSNWNRSGGPSESSNLKESSLSQFGKMKNDSKNSEISSHVQRLAPSVTNLRNMEILVQLMYLQSTIGLYRDSTNP